MHMRVVRSNDPTCTGRCSDWIALDGPIGAGSATKFAQLIRSLGARRLPVLVQSNGGSVQDAMAMGRLIRSRHLDVAVSRTMLTSCPGDRAACEHPVAPEMITGKPVTRGAFCASSCSFLLAGGERRFVALDAYVGVHQFRAFRKLVQVARVFRVVTRRVGDKTVEVSRTLQSERPLSSTIVAAETTPRKYDEAQRYFAAMGIYPRLMELAEATPASSIHWLTLGELATTRMDTEGKDGSYLITHATAEPSVPASSSPPVSAPLPAPAPQPAALPDAWAATLDTDETSDHAALHLLARTVWGPDGRRPTPTLLATLEWPGTVGRITVRFIDGATAPGRPEYRIELGFEPGADSPFATVLAAGTPAVRVVADQKAVDLPCTVAPPALGVFTITLDAGPAGDTTRRLLSRDGTLEFPFINGALRKLRIALPRGPAAIDAFRQWRNIVNARLPAG